METSPHLQGAYGVDVEKGLHTFSGVRSCFLSLLHFPLFSLHSKQADNAEKQPLLYPTVPAPIVDHNNDLPDAPSTPPHSWQAAEGVVLDQSGYPNLFILRKLEAASPTTSSSGIYKYHIALSATLLIKNMGWIPDSISVPSNIMQRLWLILYEFLPGSLKFEPGPAGLFSWVVIPTHTSPFSRLISYPVILFLSGFSFNDFPFPSFEPKLFHLLFQKMAELSLSQGWEIYPEYFEALSWSLHYLFLLLILDYMLSILCTFSGRFPATGPNPDALLRFYITVGMTMCVLTYLVFVWSWNTQLGYQ